MRLRLLYIIASCAAQSQDDDDKQEEEGLNQPIDSARQQKVTHDPMAAPTFVPTAAATAVPTLAPAPTSPPTLAPTKWNALLDAKQKVDYLRKWGIQLFNPVPRTFSCCVSFGPSYCCLYAPGTHRASFLEASTSVQQLAASKTAQTKQKDCLREGQPSYVCRMMDSVWSPAPPTPWPGPGKKKNVKHLMEMEMKIERIENQALRAYAAKVKSRNKHKTLTSMPTHEPTQTPTLSGSNNRYNTLLSIFGVKSEAPTSAPTIAPTSW